MTVNAVAIAKRKANVRCALGIIASLLALTLFSVMGMAAASQPPTSPVVIAIGGMAAVIALIASTVLAIIGIVETSRRGARRVPGRGRAITALVLNGIFFVIMLAGFVTSLSRNGAFQAKKPAGVPVKNETWNFRLETPSDWREMDPKALGPAACAALGRNRPEMYSMVFAEHIEGGREASLAGTMELIKHSLRDGNPAEFLKEEEKMEQGRTVRTLELRKRGGKETMFFVQWMTQHQGTMYRIVTWGADSEAHRVRAEASQITAGFQLLDLAHTAVPPTEVAPPIFISPNFGYTLDMRGTPWTRRWTSLVTDNPDADFGVQTMGGTAGFCVFPVWIGHEEVPLDILTQALLSRVDMAFPSEQVNGDNAFSQKSVHGRALRFERPVNGHDFVYHARILQGRGFAYLLLAGMSKSSSTPREHLEQVMDRVDFPEKGDPKPELKSDRQRETHALVYNSIGLGFDQQGHVDAAAEWYKRGFEAGSANPIILSNYVNACLRNGAAKPAVEYLDKVIDRFPGNQKIAALRATAQAQAGDVEGALRSYAQLFREGWKNDASFSGYVSELIGRKDFPAARAAIEQYTAGGESNVTRRSRALLVGAEGDMDGAIGQLVALRDQAPSDVETSFALTDMYFAASRFTDAIGECERLNKVRGETVDVLNRLAMAELSLKRYREAKKTLEKSLAKSPGNAETKRMVEVVSGLLGEGSNSVVKSPIAPVEIPESLRTVPKPAATDEYLRGYSAWYRYALRAISYKPGEEYRTTDAQMIEIRDQQGVEKFSSLQFSFDPLGEEIFVNTLVVRDAAGETLSQGKVEDSYVMDNGADQSASQGKILHVPVSGLRPGCTVEVVVTRREMGLIKAFSYQNATLAKALPVLRSSLSVRAPAESIRWEIAGGVPPPKRDDGVLTWTMEKPAVYRLEPLQALPETFLPMIWIGDAGATWAGVGREYLDLVKGQLAPDEKVREASKQAVHSLTTRAAKSEALARFVQREIAYKAIEFGRRALVPNPAAKTLSAKYGDCKDHAVLLAQLLESAGIDARLALVNSGGDLRPKLPSLDQFNHMIVYLPDEKGGRFLDCTGKTSNLRVGPPMGLAARSALILDPASPRLASIPAYPVDGSTMESDREIAFTAERHLEVKEQVQATGVIAAGLRAALLAIEPPERIRYLQRVMTRIAPALDLTEAIFTGLEDPQATLGMRLHYTLRDRFQQADDRLVGQLPAIWERLYISEEAETQRLTPFQVWVPTRLRSQTRVTLPAGWGVTPSAVAPVENPFFQASARTSMEGKILRAESTLQQRAGSFAAGQYRDFLTASRQVQTLVEQNFVLKRTGK